MDKKNEPSLALEIRMRDSAIVNAMLHRNENQGQPTIPIKQVPRLILYSADEYSQRQSHWRSARPEPGEKLVKRFASGRVIARVDGDQN